MNLVDEIKLILLIIFQMPAILLSIIILAYFAFHPNARSKPQNHIWLVLLILYLLQLITDLPMPISFYYSGRVLLNNSIYYAWWSWYESSLSSIGLYLMAWASVERHLLIFHSHTIMRVKWKRWLLHFLPIILCFLWISIFHFIFIVICPTCTTV